MSALSAIGSATLPTSVTHPRLRARPPSMQSVMEATVEARRRPPAAQPVLCPSWATSRKANASTSSSPEQGGAVGDVGDPAPAPGQWPGREAEPARRSTFRRHGRQRARRAREHLDELRVEVHPCRAGDPGARPGHRCRAPCRARRWSRRPRVRAALPPYPLSTDSTTTSTSSPTRTSARWAVSSSASPAHCSMILRTVSARTLPGNRRPPCLPCRSTEDADPSSRAAVRNSQLRDGPPPSRRGNRR